MTASVTMGQQVKAIMSPRQMMMLLALSLWVGWPPSLHAEGLPNEPDAALEPEFQRLRSQLSALPEFSGGDANSKLRLAEALAHRGDVQGAAMAYREAASLEPTWSEPYRGLGQILLDHHDYAEAVEALVSAVRLRESDRQGWYWLGRAYMGRGAMPEAAQALELAVALEQDDADALIDLALVRMAQGEVPGAEQALSEALRLKPDDANVHRLRERLMRTRQDPEAVRASARALLSELFERR
jgi:tetratricopeptide (TPR) repeat protein